MSKNALAKLARRTPALGHRRQRGQALVEIGLFAPLLIFLLMATVDFGRVFHDYVGVVAAARAAAEAAGDHTMSDAGIRSIAESEANGTLTLTSVDISPVAPRSAGSTVTVTAHASFAPITPLIRSLVGDTLALNASAAARCY